MDYFDIQKYINIAIKRKWWIIIPFLIVLLGGFTYLLVTPRIYEAETLILVQQQRVPEDYVQPIVSSTVADRLRTIEQEVTSRTNLESIISQYGLYEESGKVMSMDAKVEKFRKVININVTNTGRSSDETNAFTISFRCEDPKKAMDVTNTLAYNFISENVKIREEQALGTSTFLSDELESVEERLKNKEEELKEYKERYMGGLPEQLQTNETILQRLQMNLEQLNANLRDAENRRIELLKEVNAASAALPSQPIQEIETSSLEDDLASKKNELASLESRYTQNHPDVISLRETIAALRKEIAASKAQSESSADEVTGDTTEASIDQTLRHQLQEINIDIANYKANIEDTNAQIKLYQRKVEDTPKREQELLSLNRDYDNLRELYNSLLNRKLEAELAVSMEKKQKGEQFKIIDTAKIPTIPVEPEMRKIALMTLLLGLGLGCGLAYLMEMMDTSYRIPDDVEKGIQLPILATLPIILTEKELGVIKRNNMIAYTGVATGFILSAMGILLAVKGVDGSIDLIKGLFINV